MENIYFTSNDNGSGGDGGVTRFCIVCSTCIASKQVKEQEKLKCVTLQCQHRNVCFRCHYHQYRGQCFENICYGLRCTFQKQYSKCIELYPKEEKDYYSLICKKQCNELRGGEEEELNNPKKHRLKDGFKSTLNINIDYLDNFARVFEQLQQKFNKYKKQFSYNNNIITIKDIHVTYYKQFISIQIRKNLIVY